MTFWILLAIAGFLTLLSIRRYNLIFSFAGALGWMAVWGYHLEHPPANITVGTLVYDLLYYTFIIMAIAVIYLYFAGRSKRESTTSLSVEDGKIVANTISETQGTTGESVEEYRNRMHRRILQGRARSANRRTRR
jgi:hypothetical protein